MLAGCVKRTICIGVGICVTTTLGVCEADPPIPLKQSDYQEWRPFFSEPLERIPQRQILGLVLTDLFQPLPGVTVILKGSEGKILESVTDGNGNYIWPTPRAGNYVAEVYWGSELVYRRPIKIDDTIRAWVIKLDTSESKGVSASLSLARFADGVYFLTKSIGWTPDAQLAGKFRPVGVPAGFVVTFDSIPRIFWSLVRPDSAAFYPMVVHEYLYWAQTSSRDVADEIFKLGLQDVQVDSRTVAALYQAVRFGGDAVWSENARLKAQGERRILKEYPRDPTIRWVDWKKRPGVF